MELVEQELVRHVEVGEGDVGRRVELARRHVEEAVHEPHVDGAIYWPDDFGERSVLHDDGRGHQVGVRVETGVRGVHSGVA